MPWKASSVREERLRFVARLVDGEAMTDAVDRAMMQRCIAPRDSRCRLRRVSVCGCDLPRQ